MKSTKMRSLDSSHLELENFQKGNVILRIILKRSLFGGVELWASRGSIGARCF